jgi:hypothetical protein
MRSQRDSADGLLSLARMARMEGQDRIVAGTPAARDAGGRPAIGASDLIGTAPWSDHDPYTDESLLDPWPGYKQMRDAGPAVWLPKYEMFALTRYDSVRRALQDWESFPSRSGVMMNDRMNPVLRRNTLCSDGAEHDALRDVRCAGTSADPPGTAAGPRGDHRPGRADGAETGRARHLRRRDRLGESPSGDGGVQPTTCIIHLCRPRGKPTSPTIISAQPIGPSNH